MPKMIFKTKGLGRKRGEGILMFKKKKSTPQKLYNPRTLAKNNSKKYV